MRSLVAGEQPGAADGKVRVNWALSGWTDSPMMNVPPPDGPAVHPHHPAVGRADCADDPQLQPRALRGARGGRHTIRSNIP